MNTYEILCIHSLTKNECKMCKYKCIHNRQKPKCRDCGGGSICDHDRIKSNSVHSTTLCSSVGIWYTFFLTFSPLR